MSVCILRQIKGDRVCFEKNLNARSTILEHSCNDLHFATFQNVNAFLQMITAGFIHIYINPSNVVSKQRRYLLHLMYF